MNLHALEKISWLNPKDLKPHPKNRNKHPKDQIERLAKILKYQGFRKPIVVSNLSGYVVEGHGRIQAALHNKWERVPVCYQDFEDETQEYAHLTADNAIALWAELDMAGINSDTLELGPFDTELLGIQNWESIAEDKYADKDADAIPETDQNEMGVKLGDIYQLGEHRLMCGDSTDFPTVEKLMDGQKADMVYTDPPYGMNLDASYSNMAQNSSKYKTKRKPYEQVIGDDKPFDASRLLLMFDYCQEIFLWGADYYCWTLPGQGSWVVWDKREDTAKGINTDGMFGSSFELCWSLNKHSRDIARFVMSGGYMNKHDKLDKRVHPTQKPVALAEWFFDRWGKESKLIVDIYLGSGSTLIACEKTNRKCYGMELDPHYCSVIIKRWQDFTGKSAIKL